MLLVKYQDFEYYNKYSKELIKTDLCIPLFFDEDMFAFNVLNNYVIDKVFYENAWRSENTIKSNSQHLLDFFIYLESNNLKWDEVTHQYLNQWRENIKTKGLSGKSLNNNTVNYKIAAVSSFYLWAYIEKIINVNPFTRIEKNFKNNANFNQRAIIVKKNILVHKLPTNKVIIKVPTLEELKLFFAAKMPIETQLMALFIYDTGLRRDELYSLDLKSFKNATRFDNFTEIYLNNDSMNTKRKKNRKIIISNDLYDTVEEFTKSESQFINRNKFLIKNKKESTRLFITRQGNNYSGDTLNKSFNSICEKVFCNKNFITPHTLRHSFATHNLVYNLDKFNGSEERMLSWLSNRLGHSSVNTTREHYIHFVNDLKIKENDTLTKFEENINSIYKEIK